MYIYIYIYMYIYVYIYEYTHTHTHTHTHKLIAIRTCVHTSRRRRTRQCHQEAARSTSNTYSPNLLPNSIVRLTVLLTLLRVFIPERAELE